jgi:parallel beta-helix repeat protein
MSRPAKLPLLAFTLLGFLSVGPTAPADSGSFQVAYTGERGTVSGSLDLRAKAASKTGRVVAVTFRLDGRPLVSSTVAPYSRTIDLHSLSPGRHRLSVAAVDSLGHRARTKAVTVTIPRARARILTVAPGHGLQAGLAGLARGATVRFRPGRYVLTDVRLGSGARLLGSGAGTILAAPAGPAYRSILIAAGRHIQVSDLTLDGAGPGGGSGNGVEVLTGASDVLLRHLRIVDVRKLGVFAWGAYSEVSLQDSTVDGGGTADAGFIAGESGSFGESRDSSVIRTTLRRFTNWGMLFAHQAYGRPEGAKHAVALDNLVTDVKGANKASGTAEGGIWSGSVEGAIIGNTVLRMDWDGIETVGSSDRTSVVANRVATTRTGIYLEHSTNDSLIARNRMSGVEAGIIVEWSYGGVASKRNAFVGNTIVGASKNGLIVSIGADQNRITGNTFIGGARPMIVLQGSSDNVVRGNESCLTKGTLVAEESAPDEHGSPAYPRRNVITGNRHRSSCN